MRAGTVTAGNASEVNDGAAGLIFANEDAIKRQALTPVVRILGGVTADVSPRIMGIGPVPAAQKLLARLGMSQTGFNVSDANEAFASQALATLLELGFRDNDERINPNGGAIALGHPFGMSGARIAGTVALQLKSGENQFPRCASVSVKALQLRFTLDEAPVLMAAKNSGFFIPSPPHFVRRLKTLFPKLRKTLGAFRCRIGERTEQLWSLRNESRQIVDRFSTYCPHGLRCNREF
jgi:hypothetical protein